MAATGFLLFKGTYGPLAAMLKLTQETRWTDAALTLGESPGGDPSYWQLGLRTNTFSLTRGLATSYRRPSEWLQELGTTAGAAVQYVLNSLSAPPPSQTNDGVASYIDAVAR